MFLHFGQDSLFRSKKFTFVLLSPYEKTTIYKRRRKKRYSVLLKNPLFINTKQIYKFTRTLLFDNLSKIKGYALDNTD